MELSITIARILSIVYLSFALGLIISKDFYKREIPKLITNSALLIYGGFMAVVFGYLIIHSHNTWKNDWTTIITLIGWIALIKGIVLLIVPQSYTIYKNKFFNESKLITIILPITLLLGIILAYFGFTN